MEGSQKTKMTLNKKELKKAFESGLISPDQYKEQLFTIETSEKPKKQAKKVRVAISEEEFVSLMKHTKSKKHKLAFLLAWSGSLRIGDIVNLKPQDINLQDKSIYIKNGKGGKEAIIPLPKGFKEEHLKLIPIGIGKRALQKAFKRNAKNAGILEKKPSAHFHSLRHGFATHALKKGISLLYLKTLMRHSSISTTNVYLEESPAESKKAYEELF